MASISFTDATGAATLQSSVPAPANRFANWTPDAVPIGPREPALATGILVPWDHRIDYGASLELDKLPTTVHAVAVRLKLHLLNGGTCTVTTGDTGSRIYTCRLWPGTVPEIQFSDRRRLRYTFAVKLKNTAAATMACEY